MIHNTVIHRKARLRWQLALSVLSLISYDLFKIEKYIYTTFINVFIRVFLLIRLIFRDLILSFEYLNGRGFWYFNESRKPFTSETQDLQAGQALSTRLCKFCNRVT